MAQFWRSAQTCVAVDLGEFLAVLFLLCASVSLWFIVLPALPQGTEAQSRNAVLRPALTERGAGEFWNDGHVDRRTSRYALPPLAAKDSVSAKQSRKNRKLSGQVSLSCPQPRSVRVQSLAMSTVSPRPVQVHAESASLNSPKL